MPSSNLVEILSENPIRQELEVIYLKDYGTSHRHRQMHWTC